MHQHNHRDLLIVGYGIAGAMLAWNWVHRLGRRAWIIDNNPRSNATRAAAGILNPVTGKRLVKSWNVDALLPEARASYREIESATGHLSYHDNTIRRLYQSEEERQRWNKRTRQEAYQPFLGETYPAHSLPQPLQDERGSFDILGVGNLDTDRFLNGMQQWARDTSLLVEGEFRHQDLQFRNEHLQWGDVTFDQVVFCEGYRVRDNPWFSWLPFNLAKGEILTFEGLELPFETILSKHKWLLPLGHGRAVAGSTWSWEHLNELPSPQGRSALLQGLKAMLGDTDALTVTEHRAGIRPCTRDRFPYLGTHPKDDRLHVFNGFGSKGALLTPLMAKEFSRYLQDGTPFNPEADIKRVIDPCLG